MNDPPAVSIVIQALRELEALEKELANLPVESESERARLHGSIEELRRLIRSLVA